MNISDAQRLNILNLIKSDKMIAFINAHANEHSLQSSVRRLIDDVVNNENESFSPPINFNAYIYGDDTSPLAQNDSEQDIVVKALLIGVATKKKLHIINHTLDAMVDSYGLSSLLDELLTEFK